MEDKMVRVVSSLFLALPLFAAEQLLEVYSDKAFLTQRFEVGSGLFKADLPQFVTLEALHVKSSCGVNDKRLGAPMQAHSPHLEEQNEAKKALDEAKRALQIQEAKERLLERINIEGDFEKIDKYTEKFEIMLDELLREKAKLKKAFEEAKQKHDALQTSAMTQKVKPLELTLACDGPSLLELRYPAESLEAKRQNRFEGDIENGTLEVEQNLFLTHRLGVDLVDVTLHLYGYSYHERLAPPAFYPWYINAPFSQQKRAMVSMAAPMNESMQAADSIQSNNQSKQFWEISGLTLPSNETIQVPLDNQRLFAKFDVFVDGYAQGVAYIRGQFTPQKSIDKAVGEFILGGALVGEGWHESFKKEDKSEVYFGKNEHIGIEKNVREDFTTSNPSQKTQTTQLMYEYTLVNRGEITYKINLSERVPVSKNGDVHVKLLGDNPSSSLPTGEVVYEVSLEAGEQKNILFGYSTTKPLPQN